MNLRRVVLLALVLVVTTAGASFADEGAPATDQATILSKGIDLVRARVQAQVGLADTLREAGRLDEAIQAYRLAASIYDTEFRRIERLIGFAVAARPALIPEGSSGTTARIRPESSRRIDEARVPPFASRGAKGQQGSTRRAADAVHAGLRWLAAHQSPNGGWQAEGFAGWCDLKPAGQTRPDGQGDAQHDVGVTGLALCAYLGAGYTNRGKHPFAKTIGMGLRYLKNVQDPEGCFGPRSAQLFIYGHATAALAMVEAYGMTGSPIFKGSAQRALNFIAMSRNPYMAWRYGVKPGDNDTSVSGWMLMPLKSAQMVNANAKTKGKPEPLKIDNAAFAGMKAWLDKVTDPDTGEVGYNALGSGEARPQELMDRFPSNKSHAMTATGILARTFMGENMEHSQIIQKGLEMLRDQPPVWNPSDGSIDMIYWYAGLLSAYQAGGETWNIWRTALESQILPHQRMDTDYCGFKGSWDPIGVWGTRGGRVYSTALMTMCAEVFYRYDRVAGTK